MLDFNVYKMSAHPRSSDFTHKTTVEYNGQVKEVSFKDEQAYKKAMKNWLFEQSQKRLQFESDFYQELGIINNPKKEILYSLCLEYSDSNYEDAMDWGYKLVVLIE